MNNNNIIKILGLSKRAGKLAVGEDPVHELASNKKARLILIASDAADNTVKRANNISNKLSVPVVTLTSTKAELGHILSRKSCAVCALSDSGFCANIVSKLALDNPEYVELANEFKEKHNKILLRKKKKPKTKKTASRLTDAIDNTEQGKTTTVGSIQSPSNTYNKDNKYSKDKPRSYSSDDKKDSYNKDSKYSKDKPRSYSSDDKRSSYNKDNKYSKDKPRSYSSDDKKGSYNKDSKYSKDKPRSYSSDDKRSSYNKDNKYSKDKPRSYSSDDKRGSYNKDSKYSKDKPRSYSSDDKKDSYNKDNKYSKDNKNTNSKKPAVKWSDFKREQGRTRFSPK